MKMKTGEKLAKTGLRRLWSEVADTGRQFLTYEQSLYESICLIRARALNESGVNYLVQHNYKFLRPVTTAGFVVTHPKLKGLSFEDYVKDQRLLHYAVRRAIVKTRDDFADAVVGKIMQRDFSNFYSLVRDGSTPLEALVCLADKSSIESNIKQRVKRYIEIVEGENIEHETDIRQMTEVINSIPTWQFSRRPKIQIPEI